MAIIFHLLVLASRHFSFRFGRSLTGGESRHSSRVLCLVGRKSLEFPAIAETQLVCPRKHFRFSSQSPSVITLPQVRHFIPSSSTTNLWLLQQQTTPNSKVSIFPTIF